METSTVEDMPTNLNVMQNAEMARRARPRAVDGGGPDYGENMHGQVELPRGSVGSGRPAVI